MIKVGVAKIALVLAMGTLPLLQCSLPARRGGNNSPHDFILGSVGSLPPGS